MKKTFLFLIFISIVASCLTGCSLLFGQKITVNYDGGTNDNLIIDENTEFKDIIFSKPTKEGYVFAGWYSDANFNDYINPSNITKTQEKQGTAYAKWIVVKDFAEYTARTHEATITDSGRSKQQMDIVRISSDYNVLDLQRAGYKNLLISIDLQIREIDDGYQYVFLYRDQYCTDSSVDSLLDIYDKYIFGETKEDPSLLYMYKYEHGPGYENTNWSKVSFEVEIPLTSLVNDLYLRYGASGKNDDDWRNKEINLKVTPIK